LRARNYALVCRMTASDLDAAETASAIERTRKSYDLTPYVSAPLIRFQPGRLAANALWFGLAAPDAARSRVLEIGCASGGHILPLAAQNAQSFFLGVDLSPAQIAAGEARRNALGLTNLELRALSLSEIGAADGLFDFILCHSVYSWVPEAVRDELMRVIRERLAPEGIAMVSFNVLPGWRIFQMARDAMNAHCAVDVPSQTRAQRTRWLFEALASHSPEKSAYGAFWRNEARRMSEGDDSYLEHEIFEDSNTPETFDRFCDRLEANDLAYLCEAAMGMNGEDGVAPAAAETIRALANGGERARGRYLDIFSGRTFREALIVHGARVDGSLLAGRPQTLDHLSIVAPLDMQISRDETSAGRYCVGDPNGGVMVEGEVVAQAVRTLIARLPAASRLDDLAPPPGPEREAVRDALARLAAFGEIDLSTIPTPCAAALGERPKAFSVAAADAKLGDSAVNVRHAAVKLAPFQRLLLPLLDGTRTRADVVAFLVRMADGGGLKVRGADSPAALRARLETMVEDCLEGFRRNAMLVD